jgi:hypothetical protein
MSFIFNKLPNLLCMMDTAVIQNKNTLQPRIRVGEWYLQCY